MEKCIVSPVVKEMARVTYFLLRKTFETGINLFIRFMVRCFVVARREIITETRGTSK